MKLLPYCLIGLLFFGFISHEEMSYEKEKGSILSQRNSLRAKWNVQGIASQKKELLLKDAGNSLQTAILTKLIPHWYGTEWDFNGFTSKPGEGKIACGYFVSTILLHSGLNINRYKMAQKHSFEEVRLYSCGEKIYDYSGLSKEEFIRKVRQSNVDGLYVLGLDNHIGFLLYEKNILYFIHSNYRSPSQVAKERAEESLALDDSDRFMYTSITGNNELLRKWITGSKIGD